MAAIPGSGPALPGSGPDRAALLAELAAARERAAELSQANEALRRSMARQVEAPDIASVLDVFLLEAMRATGASGGAVARRAGQEGTEFEFAAMAQGEILTRETAAVDFVASFRAISRRDPAGFFARMVRGEFVAITSGELAAWYPQAADYHREQGNRIIWNLPFRVGGKVAGYLGLAFAAQREIAGGERETLVALADLASLSLELRQKSEGEREATVARERERAAQERAAELTKANEALRKGVSGLARLENLNQFLGEMLRAAAEVAGAHTGAVMLLADEDRSFRAATLLDRDGQLAPAGSPILGTFPIAPAFREYLARMADSAEGWPMAPDDPVMQPEFLAFHADRGNRALRHVPMRAGERLVGWLGLGFPEPEPAFGKSHALLEVLADQMTLAVELTRLAEGAQAGGILAERHRIAREIHDTIAQSLAGVSIHLEAAELDAEVKAPVSLRAHLAQARGLARGALREARRSILALRPEALDGSTLCAALAKRAAGMAAAGGPPLTVGLVGAPRPLPAETEAEMLRIGQEAITNAIRHAGASAVEVTVEFSAGFVTIRVQDDGRGFDPAQPGSPDGFGLLGMRERAARIGGELTTESRPGAGTEVRLRVPLD